MAVVLIVCHLAKNISQKYEVENEQNYFKLLFAKDFSSNSIIKIYKI